MLERFRQRYPVGSLSSELLTIDRGKYLVRASIQVNGTLLGTGMGEGDTIEQAEDRARLRAIAVLALDSEVVAVSPPATETEPPKAKVLDLSPPISATEPEIVSSFPSAPTPVTEPQAIAVVESSPAPIPVAEPEAIAVVESLSAPIPVAEPEAIAVVESLSAPIPVTEPEAIAAVESLSALMTVTEPKRKEGIAEPVSAEIPAKPAPTSKKQQEIPLPVAEPLPLVPAKTEAEPLLGEPIDFSEVIAKSDMELKRLGWTNEQGRNYLLATYGKRSRQLLSDEELIEFMQYLQSL